jgi:hypothetical protein
MSEGGDLDLGDDTSEGHVYVVRKVSRHEEHMGPAARAEAATRDSCVVVPFQVLAAGKLKLLT